MKATANIDAEILFLFCGTLRTLCTLACIRIRRPDMRQIREIDL